MSAEKGPPIYGPCNAECNGCPECDPGLRPVEKDAGVQTLRDAANWLRGAAEKCCQCTDGHHAQQYTYGTESDVRMSRDTARALASWLDTAGADLWAHGPLCCLDGCEGCDDSLWMPHVRQALAAARGVLTGSVLPPAVTPTPAAPSTETGEAGALHPCQRRPHYGEPCECEARLALVTTHTRTSTGGQGPDYCAECSQAISEWVPWPCEATPATSAGVGTEAGDE